jgi:hypothetical protein
MRVWRLLLRCNTTADTPSMMLFPLVTGEGENTADFAALLKHPVLTRSDPETYNRGIDGPPLRAKARLRSTSLIFR